MTEAPTESDPTNARTVVVAEDEVLIRMDLAEMLTEEGYEVVGQAGDGAAAVELAERLRPDLVILDVKMPVLDGIAAAERIAAARIAPVVILTAFSQRNLVERARDAGAMAYLVKPFIDDVFRILVPVPYIARLHQVRHRARVARPLDEVALAERGEDDDRGDPRGRDPLRGGDAVQDGHLHVEDDQVRSEPLGELDRGRAVTGLADDLVPLFGEHLREVHPDEHLVLGHHDGARVGRVTLGGRLGHARRLPSRGPHAHVTVLGLGAVGHERHGVRRRQRGHRLRHLGPLDPPAGTLDGRRACVVQRLLLTRRRPPRGCSRRKL